MANEKKKPPKSAEELLERYAAGERDFKGANLSWAELREVDLRGANLHKTDLRLADLSNANLRKAILVEAKLGEANLANANLKGALLCRANLYEANLEKANLNSADLRGADLIKSDLRGANFSWANLSATDLRESDLSGANLIGANFVGAKLSWANLNEAKLSGADLRGSIFNSARISTSSLRGAIYDPEQLADAIIIDDAEQPDDTSQPRTDIDRWMSSPATLRLRLTGPRLSNRDLLLVSGILEHLYCSVFTMLHRPYKDEVELNMALVSPYAEVPPNAMLRLSEAKTGSIEIKYEIIQTFGWALAPFVGIQIAKGCVSLVNSILDARGKWMDQKKKSAENEIDVEMKSVELEEKKIDVEMKRAGLKLNDSSGDDHNDEQGPPTTTALLASTVPLQPLSTNEGEEPSPASLEAARIFKEKGFLPAIDEKAAAKVLDANGERIDRLHENLRKTEVQLEMKVDKIDSL